MEQEGKTSTDLVVYVAPGLRDRAEQWSSMPADERRRSAMIAASMHDAGALGELTVAFLLLHGRQHAAASDHTIRAYATGVRRLLLEWEQENLLHPSLDAGDRYISSLSMGHAASTCSARLAAGAALYHALQWSHATTADPFAGVKAPRNRTPRHERRHPYSDAQVAAIAGEADDRLRLLILLCAHAGLRIAEAQALRWADVHVTGAYLRIQHGKGGKDRTVYLSHTLQALLELEQAKDPDPTRQVVERADGQPSRDASWLRRRLRIACALAGVEYLGWHAFRHTAGTRLARETGNLQLVAGHLGHADVSTAAIYAKWSETALADQVATW